MILLVFGKKVTNAYPDLVNDAATVIDSQFLVWNLAEYLTRKINIRILKKERSSRIGPHLNG